MRAMKTALAGMLAIPAVTAVSAPADAGPMHGVLAKYHGRTIDLAQGWQGAHACLAIDRDDVRCYDTSSEMYAARDRLLSQRRTLEALSCGSNAVTVFTGANYSGSSLALYGSANWRNLDGFGFNNTVESWVNQRTCDNLLADGANGAGDWLVLGANSKAASMGSWANRASSAFVYV